MCVEAAGAAAPLQAVRARGVQQLRGQQGGAALQVQSVVQAGGGTCVSF